MPPRRASAAPCRSILRSAPPDHARRRPIVLAALSFRPPSGRPVRSLERQFQPPGGPPQLCCGRRRVRSHTKTLRNRYPVDPELFTTGQVVSHSARSVLSFRAPISVELATLDYRRTCNLTSCWAANLSRAREDRRLYRSVGRRQQCCASDSFESRLRSSRVRLLFDNPGSENTNAVEQLVPL